MFRHWLRPRPSSARRPFKPRVEQLEDILTPATFTVTTLSDALGHTGVSLRDAVASANANPDADTIVFDASQTQNPGTIPLAQGELTVASAVTISGPGANLLTVSGDSDGDGVGNTRVFNVNAGTVTISGLTITRGNAVSSSLSWGGGVLNSANLTLDEVAVTDSTAASGGGVANNGGTLTIQRSLISGNTAASFYGGGVSHSISTGNRRGSVTVTNSTVTGNHAQLSGGGINVAAATALTVTGSTIAGNTTPGWGGGLNVGDLFTVQLTDTLMADNTDGAPSNADDLRVLSTVYTSFAADHVLAESTDAHQVTNGGNGNIVGQDPKLAALADNGGPTRTMALLAGSPALNAGSADASADQRGLAVEGTRDIGAYEAHAPARKSTLPPAPYKAKKNTVLKVPATKGVLKRFTDADGDALTAVLVTGPAPSKGTLKLKPDGSFTFRPKTNVTGKVTFVVMARDANGLESSTLKFTITIT